MKRLVWLLLAVFCTALAQVPPVELVQPGHQVCHCCKIPGACGMPDCPVPASGPRAPTAVPPVLSASLAVRQVARADHGIEVKFYAPFVKAATVLVAPPASVLAAPAVSVPLFKAHCSFLT